MQYQGSKVRLAKHLKPIIEEYIDKESIYIEPFVGGANMIVNINAPKRIGYDLNHYVTSFFNGLINKTFYPPDHITKEEYKYIKNNKEENPPLTFWVGAGCSFGAKWFGNYAKDVTKDGKSRQIMARNGLDKQIKLLNDISFIHGDYKDLEITKNMVIYCDPPYNNTLKYNDDFDSEEFYQWVRDNHDKAKVILFSEYNAPDDFEVVFQKEVSCTMDDNSKKNRKVI